MCFCSSACQDSLFGCNQENWKVSFLSLQSWTTFSSQHKPTSCSPDKWQHLHHGCWKLFHFQVVSAFIFKQPLLKLSSHSSHSNPGFLSNHKERKDN